jgi:hypothetical protein
MRRTIPMLIALCALALPATAAAKEVESATLCGQDGCSTTDDRDAASVLAEGGTQAPPPKQGGAYYTVRIRMAAAGEDVGSFVVRWVPSRGLMRSPGESPAEVYWSRPSADAATLLRRLADGHRAFAAGGLGRLAADAGGQLPPEVTPPPAPSEPSGGTPALVWGAAGAAVLAAAGALVLRARRRRDRRADGPLAAGA